MSQRLAARPRRRRSAHRPAPIALDAAGAVWHLAADPPKSLPRPAFSRPRPGPAPMTKSDLIQRLAELNPHLVHRDVEKIVNTGQYL